MAKCPRCGGDNFQYDLRAVGTTSTGGYYRTGSKNSWIIPNGLSASKNRIEHQAIGFCKDCGFVNEVKPEKRAKGKKWPYILLIIAILIAPAIYLFVVSGTGGG